MADVHFVCMRDASTRAEGLASLVAATGRTIGGPPSNDEEARGAGVIVWSESARGAPAFLDACRGIISGRRAIVVRACHYPLPDALSTCPTFDLSFWRGDAADPSLAPVIAAVESLSPKDGDEDDADDLTAQVRYWRKIDSNNPV